MSSTYKIKDKTNYIDLFAGIGGFAQAAKAYNMQCVFASEIDKYSRITYVANHGHVPAGDITKIDAADIPDHDILMAGFPCQAFSVAGKRLGFEDTRGTLFFEIARILKHKQPAMFLLENVKGLKSHDQGRTLQTILNTLEGLGYQVHWKILNAKDYGVPQNRERIFFVGFKQPRDFTWPEKQEKVTLSQVLEGNFEREIGYTVRSSGRGSGLGDKHNWDTYNVTIMSDLRNGDNTVHSWDLIQTTQRQKDICQLILQNRRSKKYGNKDGNPMSCAHLQELDSTITETDLGSKRIMQIYGLSKALESMSVRELRSMLSKQNQRDWNRLMREAKEVRLPGIYSPFEIIRKYILKFSPIKLYS